MDRTGGTGLDDRVWKNISIVLGVVCALLIGVAGALMIVGHKSTTPAPSASFIAVGVDGTQPTGGTPGPTTSGSTGSQTVVGVTPTPGAASPATIVFTGLGLDADAKNDPNGSDRTITITSDGPGPVTFTVTSVSKGGTAKLCDSVDGGGAYCVLGTTAKPPVSNKGKADTAHSTWTLTLRGYGASAPAVDVSITWPSAAPKVRFDHGRFQGSPDSLNGLTATFKPRAKGTLNVQSTWSLLSVNANVTLYDASASPNISLDSHDYKAAQFLDPAYTANLDPTKTYQIKIRRTTADSSQRPDLTAQISFP
jgi:hypothetical protein